MSSTVRRRQRGQTLPLAAVAMIALIGGLAMVVDTGMFFVIQRQLQAAADAGALAGAWHAPICPADAWGCYSSPSAEAVAQQIAEANADSIRSLCPGGLTVLPPSTGTKLNRPAKVNAIVVTVQCDAGYSFGRILGLSGKRISASAAAAIGNRLATPPGCRDGGDMTDFTPEPLCGRMARLID